MYQYFHALPATEHHGVWLVDDRVDFYCFSASEHMHSTRTLMVGRSCIVLFVASRTLFGVGWTYVQYL